MEQQVVEFLKGKQSEMVGVLKSLVEIESPSLEKVMVDQVGEQLKMLYAKYVGGTIEAFENEKRGNHLRCVIGDGEDQILILAHMDTVWPRGTLKKLPFRIEGDKLYGPGSFDMKGGIVQGLFALHALQTIQVPLKSKVVMLFTSDEEIGSECSRDLIEAEAKKSKYVLVLESASSTTGKLKTSRKGVGIFTIKVNGRAAHSGIEPEKGVSAIEELARQTLYLHGLTDFEKGTTLNVGLIKGGSASNVVAAEAEAELDLRVLNNEEFDKIIPLIRGITPSKEGLSIEVTGGINRPPMEKTAAISKMFETAKDIAKDYLNFDLEEQASGGGSDGSFASQFAPTLDGLGPVGDGAHAPNEHLLISQMPVRSALVAILISRLANE
ncbi:M20 family metallopeptidase [Bacillus sp. REN16]|uniref:M20 family metallopeptidase n=1 Tax=Bacillus sp. REN16 TaxID=2887296 RepID=UPI001E4115ED|nr:M20 family metallopeptidase [Bacillus sp. REN16]MCC3356134.1 M20 family metallopeptidase [Bacillus sp. REN16]